MVCGFLLLASYYLTTPAGQQSIHGFVSFAYDVYSDICDLITPAPSNVSEAKKSNTKSSGNAQVDTGGGTASPPTGPNRPQNDRKYNTGKNESPQWRRFENVKNSRLKTTGRGSNQRYYDWDYTHNDIEVYNYRGVHLGSMDPVTGQMYKPPVPGRIINIP